MGVSIVRQISDKLPKKKPKVEGRYTAALVTPCISVRRSHVSSVLVCVCIQTCVMLEYSSVILACKVT